MPPIPDPSDKQGPIHRCGPIGMVPSVVFDDRRLTDTHRAVLGLLSTYANRDRWCHVKLRTLAERRGCSPQAVSRVLGQLAELGYLLIEPQYVEGATHRARLENKYRIVFDAPAVEPPSTSGVDPPSTPEVEPPSTPGVEVKEQPQGTAPGNSNGAAPPKRAHQLPEPFFVTGAMREWAAEEVPTVDITTETRQFVDHHRAKGSTMKDWTAAWRTWMRNAKRFDQRRAPAIVDVRSPNRQVADSLFEKLERGEVL